MSVRHIRPSPRSLQTCSAMKRRDRRRHDGSRASRDSLLQQPERRKRSLRPATADSVLHTQHNALPGTARSDAASALKQHAVTVQLLCCSIHFLALNNNTAALTHVSHTHIRLHSNQLVHQMHETSASSGPSQSDGTQYQPPAAAPAP